MAATLPLALVRPRREIVGISAVVLPYTSGGEPDWPAFEMLVDRTVACGPVPAVNMDTGFGPLLDPSTRTRVLAVARDLAGEGGFVAGAIVDDTVGAAYDAGAYGAALDSVAAYGGTPVAFPSYGLASLDEGDLPDAFAGLAARSDRFIAFELGTKFSPAGRIFSLETYRALLELPSCFGAKHSSLHREPEWERLRLRDEVRPEFHVFTGNDLAIDMVMYGSDYLLGLSAFAPDLFARRDRWWASGDDRFFELNDALQAIGAFAFRDPVPAYKHSCTQVLVTRGWLAQDAVHPSSPRRPTSDGAVLATLVARAVEAAGA